KGSCSGDHRCDALVDRRFAEGHVRNSIGASIWSVLALDAKTREAHMNDNSKLGTGFHFDDGEYRSVLSWTSIVLPGFAHVILGGRDVGEHCRLLPFTVATDE